MNEQHYEKLWKKVGKWENESPNFKTRTPQQETLDFISFLKSKKLTKGNALDIGCGGGRHVIAFAKGNFNSYGIDFSKTAIDLAKLDAKENKLEVNLKTGDVLKTKYKEDFFSVVHDSGCLHHMQKKHWKQYLNIIKNTLKSDGYYKLFCFSVNTKFLTGRKITKERNWISHKGHYSHFFTKQEIKDLFGKDFKILKTIEEKRKQGMRSFYIFYLQKR
jgi:cyclopropane fatty-acyl-phospholipid synthase-like methyltransferase